MNEYEILIVGAGIVGLSAALSMQSRGFSVAIFDSQFKVASPKNGRVYAINQASKELLQDLQVWEKIDEALISAYQKMHVWDAANGKALDFDARSIASTELGVILEESAIKQALHQELLVHKQKIHCFETVIDYIETADKTIKIGNATTCWQGQLLIIADGRDSPLRNQLQVSLFKEDYKQSALTATVRTEKSHKKTAWQVFNKEGPLAFLPLVDEMLSSIVWTTTPENAARLKTMPEEAFNAELTQAFGAKLGSVQLVSERQTFPLVMRHAKQYVGKNWLLMGDAAHTIHPLAGLGLNLGLADLKAWLTLIEGIRGNAALLSDAYDSEMKNRFPSRILQAYQRQRKYSVWKVIALVGGINSLFRQNFPPLVAVRGLGLKLGNHMAAFKRLLIEQARGSL